MTRAVRFGKTSAKSEDLRAFGTVLHFGVDQRIHILTATKNPYDFDCFGMRAVKYYKPTKI